MSYCILTCDGGGICGLFTARLLDRLSVAYPPLLTNTSLFAGTSTGGIIALGLAAGLPPADLVDLYNTKGKDIFHDSILDDIFDLGKAVGADYSNKRLKDILKKLFGAKTLGDLRSKVLVSSFDLNGGTAAKPEPWKPKFFHNLSGSDSDSTQTVVDVALRTSAAPTYFPAYQGYIDGGVVANNPSMAALAAALDPRSGKQKLENIVLLSLSTGSDSKYLKGDSLDWGWGQWARPLVSIMISGTMGVAHFQCKQILGDSYMRMDRFFDQSVALDDVKDDSLAYLLDQANAYPLDPVINWLRNRWK
jgi:patatin-like phospholipase/acyl hydrolase